MINGATNFEGRAAPQVFYPAHPAGKLEGFSLPCRDPDPELRAELCTDLEANSLVFAAAVLATGCENDKNLARLLRECLARDCSAGLTSN
jgi:hypothetical protein